MLISKEECKEQIWVYNRMSEPIFVTSPTIGVTSDDEREGEFNGNQKGSCTIHRIPPGYSGQVFDLVQAKRLGLPWYNYIFNLSFAKGWGGDRYKRQELLDCQCRLEVIIKQPHG